MVFLFGKYGLNIVQAKPNFDVNTLQDVEVILNKLLFPLN